MNLHRLLARRDRPIRVALVGAGKFATMFLAQARRTPGIHVAGIADLNLNRAGEALRRAGWPAEAIRPSLDAAYASGGVALFDEARRLIEAAGIEVVIDATGSPTAGVEHARAAIAARRHLIMVNVEADALCGPLLAEEARAAGVVYSLAYGDQPALIAELVDWARASGFEVVAAGKGTKYLPGYHHVTPDEVWRHYGLSAEAAARGGMNPQMFNSFLDGTKSAIEMTAVANATGLTPAPNGLGFPPCGTGALARLLRPAAEGGLLHHKGQVEVISSAGPDGVELPDHLRWGVYVVFEAPSDYVAACFREYGLTRDPDGRFAALYKPFHLIGLELGISVASIGVRGEPTGQPDGFRADAVACAKRDLKAGETLDGEGGYTVYARLMPAAASLAAGALPIGLAHGVRLLRPVARDQAVRAADVVLDPVLPAVGARRAMEARFAPARVAAEPVSAPA
jgi:predicted homoserine dehydrogenase-like protein